MIRTKYFFFFIVLGAVSFMNLVGCNSSSNTSTPTYSVGGSITGLTGTLVLQNNKGNDLTLKTGNKTFSFSNKLTSGAAYSVKVLTQPVSQTCTVTSGSGTIASADISSVAISCTSTTKITGVNPNSGDVSGGATVYITGYHFTDATAVTFGDTDATSFTVVSDNSITAVVPAGTAGTVDVSVTTALNTSATSAGDAFTYGERTVYIASPDDNSLYNCTVDTETGDFSDCANAITSSTLSPVYAGMVTIGDNQYVQFSAENNHTFTSCLASDPTALTCEGAVSVYSPNVGSFASYTLQNKQYIYLVLADYKGLLLFKLRSDGKSDFGYINVTPATTPTGWTTNSITLQTIGGVQYAYLTGSQSGSDFVLQCTVDPDTGLLSECAKSTVGDNPSSITFGILNSTLYAYVGQSSGTAVYFCDVDTTTGELTGCATTATDVAESPAFVAIETYGAGEFSPTYAYIVDTTDKKIHKCDVYNDGTIGSSYNCTDISSPTPSETYNPSMLFFGYVK